MPVLAIYGVERREIHLVDRLDHEPREVPLRQPIADVGRQQKRLLTIGRDEVLAHADIVLIAPDRPPFTQQPPCKATMGALALEPLQA